VRVIDSWTGGASPCSRYRYRLVEISLHEYRVEVSSLESPDMDASYRPITRGSRHSIALRVGELLRLEYESSKERKIKMVASA